MMPNGTSPSKGIYAPHEKAFVELFVDRLEHCSAFQEWLLARAGFRTEVHGARLLMNEMYAKRTKGAHTWWGSHYQMKCACPGCFGGKETDLLAIFELSTGRRCAIHVEIKNERDHFRIGQAALYPVRALCWLECAPAHVLPHDATATVLFCDKGRLASYGDEVSAFDAVITSEEIKVFDDNLALRRSPDEP